MKIPISGRLLACCDFVAHGDRVADIGCDHGYLSIYLVTAGIAPSAIAADIRRMPLLSAVRNAEKFGVRDKIRFCLSNGVQSIPRDFDCLVCAGMGADTIISILSDAPWLKSPQYRLVLQCQSKAPMLRQFLSENGWCIQTEPVLRDGRFLYTVMAVSYQRGCTLTPGQWYISPAMAKNPTPETLEYYRLVLSRLKTAAIHRGQEEPLLRTALVELENLKWDMPEENDHDNGC